MQSSCAKTYIVWYPIYRRLLWEQLRHRCIIESIHCKRYSYKANLSRLSIICVEKIGYSLGESVWKNERGYECKNRTVDRHRKLAMTWTPGHEDIQGNEDGDLEAKEEAVSNASPTDKLPPSLRKPHFPKVPPAIRKIPRYLELLGQTWSFLTDN